MKHLETTPWFICDENDENLCAYVDTDSNYFNAEPLLLHLYPDFEQKTNENKDEILEKVALYYQDFISDHYDNLAKDCFNVTNHRLEMKTECVIRSAYFRATRRYAQWITKQEGITKESLDVKGLEYKKSNFPKVFGNFFKQVVEDVLKGTQQSEIDTRILNFKKKILNDMPIGELGNPKIGEFLDKFADKEKVFDTILLNKLEGFYDDLGWKLVTNPYVNQFFI